MREISVGIHLFKNGVGSAICATKWFFHGEPKTFHNGRFPLLLSFDMKKALIFYATVTAIADGRLCDDCNHNPTSIL